ncbi:hypothetical protein BDV12DRAFT_164275 [Aspergillus spectabilis]
MHLHRKRPQHLNPPHHPAIQPLQRPSLPHARPENRKQNPTLGRRTRPTTHDQIPPCPRGRYHY